MQITEGLQWKLYWKRSPCTRKKTLFQAYTPQIRGARIRADRLKEELRILAPEAEERLEKLETELGSIHFCREQAFLLAGVSIGLELGRL